MSKALEKVSEKMIALVEQIGDLPWKKPWKGGKKYGFGNPTNPTTKRVYSGGNVMILGMAALANGWPNLWGGFKQWSKLHGRVKKGEKGTPILVPRIKKVVNDDGDEEDRFSGFFCKYVWNICQTTVDFEIEEEKAEDKPFTPIQRAEEIVVGYKTIPVVTFNEPRAYYQPSKDIINMPKQKSFNKPEEFYSTLFHEMVHSTGHSSRLDREGVVGISAFGGKTYSFEELVAEFGACMLCSEAGILPKVEENSAAYLAGWLKKLKSNPEWLYKAADKAVKAAEYIL